MCLPYRLVDATYLSVIALISTAETLAEQLRVPSSTRVFSVVGSIELAVVIFVPRGMNDNLSLPSPNQAMLPTPVRAVRLQYLLDGYDHSAAEFLRLGFTAGFRIQFEGNLHTVTSKILLSAYQHPHIVDLKIRKEIDAGRIAGPFTTPPFSTFRVSPLGVVPKKAPGEFRLIHHLSYPKGFSINDGIPSKYSAVSYATIEDAIKTLKCAGQGCFLAKTDIKSAFRIVPIHPDDYHLLGFMWRNMFYYDRAMPMGCSSSCRTFEALSTAVKWIARHKFQIPYILHLLDDFLIISLSRETCSQQLSVFLGVCDYLGIPIAPEKTCGPATTLSFAGIELDSIRMEARLPQDKIMKCTEMLNSFIGKRLPLKSFKQ